MYVRDALNLPAKGLSPSAHPFFSSLLVLPCYVSIWPVSIAYCVFKNLNEQLLEHHSSERGHALALFWGGTPA
jgi:hypothetical protein